MLSLIYFKACFEARCVSKSVMPRIANPVSPVRLWDAPPNIRPGGEIGRHNGLKIRRGAISVPVRFRFWAPNTSIKQ